MSTTCSDTDRMSDDHEEASFAIAPPAQGIVLPLSTVSARKLAASLYNSSPRSHIRSRPASLSNSDSPPSSVSGKQPSKQHRNELRTWSSRMHRALDEKPLERSVQSDSGTPSLPAELKQKMALLQQAHHGRGRDEAEDDARMCFMTEKLKREQSSRRKLEMENSKLARCLVEAESAVARIEKELDKERKARKLMEDVCNELAREIGEDRVEVEKLRREQLRSRHLQKIFDWHEEGAPMKLSKASMISFEKMNQELSTLLESMRARGVDASLELQGESLRASMEELRSYGGFGGSRSYPHNDADHHHHHHRHAIVSSDSMNSSRQDERKDRFSTAALGPAKWSSQPLQRGERSFRHASSSELLAEQAVRYQSSVSELPSPKWEGRLDRGMVESRRSSVDWSNRPIKNNSLQAKLMLEDQINGLNSQLKQSRRSTR